jgi:mono/diheme cytochrome c family protein
MSRFLRILLALCAVLGLIMGERASAQDSAPPGDVANGKRVYLAYGCFECHGRVGQGGRYNAVTPRLTRTELPFEAFKAQLREPSNEMPPYAPSVTSDKEVADMYAYLQSLPAAPPVSGIAILNH